MSEKQFASPISSETTQGTIVRLHQFHGPMISAAAIHIGIAAVISMYVIPEVVADTYSAASPERAVPAFWFFVGANLLLAIWYFFIGAQRFVRVGRTGFYWVVPPVLSLLLAAPLADAALAYWSHGEPMQAVSVTLFLCVGGGAICALLALFNRKRQNRGSSVV